MADNKKELKEVEAIIEGKEPVTVKLVGGAQ